MLWRVFPVDRRVLEPPGPRRQVLHEGEADAAEGGDAHPDKPAEEADNAKLAQATKFGALLGEGTVNARSWANEQSSELDPRGLELLCRQICDRDNIEISVLQAPELSKESLGLLAAVGAAPACPPRLIVMTYMWGCRGGIT